jgi:hypothetical protein
MRKGVIISFIFVAFLIIASAAYAHSPGREYGFCNDSFTNIERETGRKYQKETLPLRDQTIAKRLNICKEIRKHNLRRDCIAKLHKERIDSRAMNQKKPAHAGIACCKKGIRINTVPSRNVFSPRCQRMIGL